MRQLKTAIAALGLFLLIAVMPGCAPVLEKTHTNSIGMEFVLIPAGSFMMGRNPALENGNDEETPQHRVTISKPFYLGKFEVTQTEWEAVMGNNPSNFKGRTKPVEKVSWNDVQEFIKRLNAKEGHNRYRLPTEAEWEYAARADTDTAYSFGDDVDELSRYGWYDDNSDETTHPVGQKQPNAWGLYDVHGNVWEWVQDWYGDKYYSNSSGTDPKGPGSGQDRVSRGGGWSSYAEHYRSASRRSNTPGSRSSHVGFRLALSAE